MDEVLWNGTGGEVEDGTGNNFAGIANGAVTVTDGRYGRAGSFDGIDDYLATPLNIDQSADSTGMTVEGWLYPTLSDATYRYVFSTFNNGYEWGLSSQYGTWSVDTGKSRYSLSGVPLDRNQWQHIAVVFTPGNSIRFYRNGVMSKEITATNMDYNTDDRNLFIGSRDAASGFFAGLVDEMAVFDRPLGAAEILDHYQAGIRFTEFVDEGLIPLTDYTYRVKAVKESSCGWTTISNSAALKTPAPPVPTDLRVVAVDTDQIELAWTDTTGSETGFRLERCAGASCDFSLSDVFPIPADATAYFDAGGCNGEPYRYRIRAEKYGDATDPPIWPTDWAELPVSVAKPELVAPDPVTASALGSNQVNLDWDDNSSDEAGFKIFRRCTDPDNVACDDFQKIKDVGAGVIHYEDLDGLEAGKTYIYTIRAFKDLGCNFENGLSSEVRVLTWPDTSDPLYRQLAATALGPRLIRLDWDDNVQGEDGFAIEVKTWSGYFALLATVGPNETSYIDRRALEPQTSYVYRIRSFAGGDKVPYSNEASATTLAPAEGIDGTCEP